MNRVPLFMCFLTLCNLTLFGQSGEFSKVVHTAEKSAIHVPPQAAPAGLTIIYTNLGKKGDLYNCCGFILSGPNSPSGSAFVFTAMPFTPKSNSHVSDVRAAVQYFSGTNQIDLSIYNDSGGVPSTLLAGPVTVTNLPDDGTCCLLAVASFSPIAVSGGTQYWVVANTPLSGVGSDFYGTWQTAGKFIRFAANTATGSGWYAGSADVLPAGEVLGTIP
jgi:hypothetical protein